MAQLVGSGWGVAVLVFGFVLVVLGLVAWEQPNPDDRAVFWQRSLPRLDLTADDFYARVFQALRTGITDRDIVLVGYGFGPRRLFEGGSIFSQRLLYLVVKYRHMKCYLLAAPTPSGFYISESMFSSYIRGSNRLLSRLFAQRRFSQQNIFQYDAVLMFAESVHAITLNVIDQLVEEQGLAPIPEPERRPVMHRYYSRVPLPGIADRFQIPDSKPTVPPAPTFQPVEPVSSQLPTVVTPTIAGPVIAGPAVLTQ